MSIFKKEKKKKKRRVGEWAGGKRSFACTTTPHDQISHSSFGKLKRLFSAVTLKDQNDAETRWTF